MYLNIGFISSFAFLNLLDYPRCFGRSNPRNLDSWKFALLPRVFGVGVTYQFLPLERYILVQIRCAWGVP